MPDRQRFLHLKATYAPSRTHRACNPPPPIAAPCHADPHRHPSSPRRAEKTRTGRPESACAIGRGQRWEMQDSVRHSSAFPFREQAFPPGRATRRGIAPAGKHRTGACLARHRCCANSTGPSLAMEVIEGGKASGDLCNSSVQKPAVFGALRAHSQRARPEEFAFQRRAEPGLLKIISSCNHRATLQEYNSAPAPERRLSPLLGHAALLLPPAPTARRFSSERHSDRPGLPVVPAMQGKQPTPT